MSIGAFNDDQIAKAFDSFDKDKSGKISADELTQALTAVLGDSVKGQKAAAFILVQFDRDGDLEISFQEFKDGVKKYLNEEPKQKSKPEK